MTKKILIIILTIAAVATIVFVTNRNKELTSPKANQNENSFDPRNSSFTIEDMPVTLIEGFAEVDLASIPDAKITTKYFGNVGKGDLNKDGKEDVAFLVTQDGGGSGLFYYVVAAIHTGTGYKTADGILIGDRIAPQSTEIDSENGTIMVNYADRASGESMTAEPTVAKTKVFLLSPDGELISAME